MFGDERLPDRFWDKVSPEPNTGCWFWTAFTNKFGYGRFTFGKTNYDGAHRWAYRALVGPIPEGLQLDHLCRQPSCVNPAHLEPVTPGENTRRGLAGKAQLARTACPRGHNYSGLNLRRRGGKRFCRLCDKIRSVQQKINYTGYHL